MPQTAPPGGGGIQALWAQFQGLVQRIASLETWQRQTRGLPSATITRWGGGSAPAGALLCDGSTFDPAVYPALFAVLGSTTLPNISGTPIYVIWT